VSVKNLDVCAEGGKSQKNTHWGPESERSTKTHEIRDLTKIWMRRVRKKSLLGIVALEKILQKGFRVTSLKAVQGGLGG